MIALIDADIVCYQAAARAETTVDWGDESDCISISGSKRETRDGIDEFISDLKEVTKADRILLAFTDDHANFRKKVYPLYKSNRKNRKPVTYPYGKAYAISKYDSMTRPSLEADDILGILATGDVAAFGGDKVVCSIDKDMRTFPCKLYNWMKKDDGIVTVTKDEADSNFFKQILMGDATDGYPGVPGIGPVKAERLLEDAWVLPPAKCEVEPYFDKAHAWEIIVDAYAAKDLDVDAALAQARCARILRFSDYDFTTKLPILWSPRGDK
jgi:DNA polymerase-1